MDEFNNIVFLFRPYKVITKRFFLNSAIDDTHVRNEVKPSNIAHSSKALDRLQKQLSEKDSEYMNDPSYTSTFLNNLIHSFDEEIIDQASNFYDLNRKSLVDKINTFLSSKSHSKTSINFFLSKFNNYIFTSDLSQLVEFSSDLSDETKYITKYNIAKESRSLFTELAKVNLFDHNEILRFSRYYGLPKGLNLINSNYKFIYFATSHLDLVLDLLRYQSTFSLFVKLKTKTKYLNRDFDLFYQIDKKYENVTHEELARRIDNELREQITHEFVYEGTFRDKVSYSNLFAVAYQQLKNALLNDSEIRSCRNCQHYFEVTHAKQSFCPALPLVKRSSCEIAYYKK